MGLNYSLVDNATLFSSLGQSGSRSSGFGVGFGSGDGVFIGRDGDAADVAEGRWGGGLRLGDELFHAAFHDVFYSTTLHQKYQ